MYIILSKYINHIEKEHSENKNLLEIKNMIAKKKELEIKLKIFQNTDMEDYKKMENLREQTHKRHNTNPSLISKREQRKWREGNYQRNIRRKFSPN